MLQIKANFAMDQKYNPFIYGQMDFHGPWVWKKYNLKITFKNQEHFGGFGLEYVHSTPCLS